MTASCSNWHSENISFERLFILCFSVWPFFLSGERQKRGWLKSFEIFFGDKFILSLSFFTLIFSFLYVVRALFFWFLKQLQTPMHHIRYSSQKISSEIFSSYERAKCSPATIRGDPHSLHLPQKFPIKYQNRLCKENIFISPLTIQTVQQLSKTLHPTKANNFVLGRQVPLVLKRD